MLVEQLWGWMPPASFAVKISPAVLSGAELPLALREELPEEASQGRLLRP